MTTTVTAATTQRLLSTYYVSNTMPGAHFALPLTPHKICGAGTVPFTLLRLRKTQHWVINLRAGVIAKGRKLWCPGAHTETWGGDVLWNEWVDSGYFPAVTSALPKSSHWFVNPAELCPFLVSSHPWCAGCGIATWVTSQGTGHVVHAKISRA